MPIYDYKCKICENEFSAYNKVEDYLKATCTDCGSKDITLLIGNIIVHTFRAGWYEHIAPYPMHINNPQELRDACDAHNCYSVYLEDSTFKTSPGPDPQGHCGTDIYAREGTALRDRDSKNVSSKAVRDRYREWSPDIEQQRRQDDEHAAAQNATGEEG